MGAELGRSQQVARGLNPLAPVFVPRSPAKQAVNKQSTDSSPPSDFRGFGQLPDAVKRLCTCFPLLSHILPMKGSFTTCAASQVLATILSCLEQPKDVLACAVASRHIRAVAEHAPLRLRICSVSKLHEEVSMLPQILQAITRHFKGKHALNCCCEATLAVTLRVGCSVYFVSAGVHRLDLSNTMVDDTDISRLMSQCTNIRELKLAGCRKLTSVGTTLFGSTSGVSSLFQHVNDRQLHSSTYICPFHRIAGIFPCSKLMGRVRSEHLQFQLLD